MRYVRCKNADPQLGALYPCIKPDREFFYYHVLPFAEGAPGFFNVLIIFLILCVNSSSVPVPVGHSGLRATIQLFRF